MDVLQGNLQYLKVHYLLARGGAKAAARIEEAVSPQSSRALRWLLRHHDEEGITDTESWKRDEVDYLLEYYSLLEIACTLNLVPWPLSKDVADPAIKHLEHPAVQKYMQHYPISLPQLLVLRLKGLFIGRVACDDAPTLFWQLLELDSRLYNDNCETFLWFIDGGSRGRYDIDSVIRTLKSSKAYFHAVSVRAREITHLTKALHGFRIFLQFCVDLDALLADPALPPLFRVEAWKYFAYWFRNLSLYVEENDLQRAIGQVAAWKQSDADAARHTASEVKRIRASVERLSSGEFGRFPNQLRDGERPPKQPARRTRPKIR